VTTVSPCDYDVISDLAVEYLCFIPLRRNRPEELHDLWLTQIIRWTIREHLQRTLIDHVHRKLVAARSQRHRLIEDWLEGILCSVAHRSRRVVHRTEEHARKRKRHVVLRLGLCAPLAPLHSADTFRVDQVRPGPRHRSRLLIAVKIDHHLAFRSFLT